jgi:predicted benzoate:H+ symporter BenE
LDDTGIGRALDGKARFGLLHMLEPPPPAKFDAAGLLVSLRGAYLVNAVVAFVFAATGPVAIILSIGQQGRLTETDIAAQNAQGFAVLEHKAPVNVITAACGLGSLITAPFGSVSTCFTGPANAILVSGGEKDQHYAAGVMMSLLVIVFGLFSPTFTQALPPTFIAALAGLALLRVLERAFVVSFSGRFTLGALVSFVIAVANAPMFSIGAPFWAIAIGFAVSWLLERKDFATLAKQ